MTKTQITSLIVIILLVAGVFYWRQMDRAGNGEVTEQEAIDSGNPQFNNISTTSEQGINNLINDTPVSEAPEQKD